MATNKISVVIDVITDRANRGLTNFRTSVKDADGAVGKFKAGAKSAGDSLKANFAPMAVAAGAAVAGFAVKAIGAASDLEQAVGAVEKSFGDASGEVLAFAENAAESVGLSERAYAEAAVRLGSFAKQIAEDTGQPVAEVLNDLIVRSSDLAATFGVDVSEAIAKVSSGLAGESEPLRAWGIDMRKTEVNAFAAAEGMESMGDATQAAGLLMDRTSGYASQFADESETLAGQQQRLGAEYENLQAELGAGLLPIMTDAVKVVRGLGDAYDFLSKQQGIAIDQIPIIGDELNSALGPMLDPLGAVADGFDGLTKALGGSSDASERTAEELYALSEASRQNRERTEAYEAATEAATAATEDAEAATAAAEAAEEDRKEALDDLLKSIDATREAEEAAREATLESIDSSLAYRNQVADTSAALAAANEVLATTKQGTDEYAQAARDAEGAALDQAAAAVRLAEDQAAANGETLSAEEKTRIYRAELESLAGQLNGDAAWAIAMHIDRLNKIPRSITTVITQKFGSLGSADYTQPGFGTTNYGRASGGPVDAGGAYLVGENGPELLQMGSRAGHVVNNQDTKNIVGSSGMSSAEMRQAVAEGMVAGWKRVQQMTRAT